MPAAPRVVVLLGTDHHRFDRLLAWAETIAATESAPWFVQHGSTPLPAGLAGVPMLGTHDLQTLLSQAGAVVSHGGPGTIMEARAAGHLPIVLPRDPRYGEHVDDHQRRFVARIAATGLVASVATLDELRREVRRSLVGGRAVVPEQPGSPASTRFGALVDELVRRS